MKPLIEDVESFSHAVNRLLRKSPAGQMVSSEFGNALVLCPVIGIAWWICRFKRELLDAKSLRIAILGAESLDAGENGRIYQFLPWLLSRPELQVEVCLVGPNLKKQSKSSGKSNLEIDQIASSCIATCGDWWSTKGKNIGIDLFVAFNPGLESHWEEWLDDKELPTLMRNDIPLAIFSYDFAEAERDRHILEGFGFKISKKIRHCPMSPKLPEIGDEPFNDVFSSACFFVEGINKTVKNIEIAEAVSSLAIAIGILADQNKVVERHADAFLECWVYRGTRLTQALNIFECIYYDLSKKEIFFAIAGEESADTPTIPLPDHKLTEKLSKLESNIERACFGAEIFHKLNPD